MNADALDPKDLRDLAAREAIRNLTNHYCHNVWQRAGAVMADLFTPDGLYSSFPSAAPVRGHEELRRFFAELALREVRTFPYIHNHVIHLDGDLASGTCYLETRSPVAAGMRTLGGFYDDEYVRTPAGWLFRSRRFNPDFDVTISIPSKP